MIYGSTYHNWQSLYVVVTYSYLQNLVTMVWLSMYKLWYSTDSHISSQNLNLLEKKVLTIKGILMLTMKSLTLIFVQKMQNFTIYKFHTVKSAYGLIQSIVQVVLLTERWSMLQLWLECPQKKKAYAGVVGSGFRKVG